MRAALEIKLSLTIPVYFFESRLTPQWLPSRPLCRTSQARRFGRGVLAMLNGGVRFQVAETAVSRDQSRSASAMAELFAPLDRLLVGGGDPRLTIDPASGLNEYGCQPFPCPDTLSFSSSTATSISQRAYDRARDARESLMRSAIAVGIEAAFDARIEALRDELKACLGLSRTRADIVFSPSGTDSQLQALFLARALLGPALTTVVVAADQTGSGTVNTARGYHFSAATANGNRVRKGEPIAGLAHSVDSVALRLFDEAGQPCPQTASDSQVLGAVERSIAGGSKVLLQIMDSSKFGWRAPSDQCLDEICGALARSGPDRRRRLPDASRPGAAAKLSRSRIHGPRHRVEVLHRSALQRRAAGALGARRRHRCGHRHCAGASRI